MDRRKKRVGMVAFVTGVLALAALASQGTTSWATPQQIEENQTVTVPPIKTVDNTLVPIGGEAVFEVLLQNPEEDHTAWNDVVLTDTIDSRLGVLGLTTTQGSIGVVGQDISVDIGDMLAGDKVTVLIYVVVEDGNSGEVIENRAYAVRPGTDPLPSNEAWITIPYGSYLPLSLRQYTGP